MTARPWEAQALRIRNCVSVILEMFGVSSTPAEKETALSVLNRELERAGARVYMNLPGCPHGVYVFLDRGVDSHRLPSSLLYSATYIEQALPKGRALVLKSRYTDPRTVLPRGSERCYKLFYRPALVPRRRVKKGRRP